MKQEIEYHALRLFDQRGYHGTSMRDVADAAGCKTPTVYHYYKSKENLYDEIVRAAYERLLDDLRSKLPEVISPIDFCIRSLIQKKAMTEDERLVHRLALKTWLGLEGCSEVQNKILAWEQARVQRNEALLSGVIPSRTWVRILTNTYTSILQRIILLDEDIADNEIIETLSLIFTAASQQKLS